MKKTLIIATCCALTLSLSAQSYHGAAYRQTPEQALNDIYCTGLFHSAEGTILDVSSSTSAKGYINLLDWLQGRVAGLQVYTSSSGVFYPVIRGNIAGIYVDEMPMDANYLNSLNINDVAMVKVIKGPFAGGFNGAGGAVAIYTLGGEDEGDDHIEAR